ncbi:protein-export chaperone SecB [Candidatus Venteria ishoeyi]|uniref:Protein-export protein SecB n=1 Tax=Candidatus Venteria ishoeyi TaxID=1899563 RepID=A0A1H6FBH6_9GAMM|nr:protein-export chaperone SecB [Candidatus Venteria ishoeyi]MDM8545003.1 protein-export chaperone SecB [Candidatus Venteria ishoeyi]SEH06993.1 Protein-export protein SecB [Candidatus Venteria ishoeyi]
MSENENPQQNTQQPPQQYVAAQKIYTKDISFETPNTPALFIKPSQQQPQVNFNLSVSSSNQGENLYEVVVNITVTVKMEDKTAFLVELQQAGLFAIAGFAQEQMPYLINSYCPNILFPFVRETVADLVSRGGFPQLLLEPIDFDSLFQQQVQQQQAQQQAQQTEEAGTATVN